MGRFKKGLFLGGLLGAAFTWMSTTKKGRETREKLLDQAADIYEDVRAMVMETEAYDKLQKADYMKIVKERVGEYGKKHKLAAELQKMLVPLVASQWKNIKHEIKKFNGKK